MDPDLEPPYPQTIGEILAGNAARLPHEAALVDPAGPRVDFAGIQSAAAAFRARLRALGVGPQDRVAVVLRPGTAASPRELRRWLLDRVGPDKVPRTVRFVDALPRNANGKVSRRALADAAAAPDPPPTAPPLA